MAKPVNPANLNGVGDNTQLMHLHEPSLLFNLRYRYGKDLIYTYTGALPASRHHLLFFSFALSVTSFSTDPAHETMS